VLGHGGCRLNRLRFHLRFGLRFRLLVLVNGTACGRCSVGTGARGGGPLRHGAGAAGRARLQ
jgi:hypothetical protein